MTDYSPVIAFAQSRIETLCREIARNPDDLTVCIPKARVNELETIVALCTGLNQQERMIEEAIGLPCGVREI